MRSHVEDYGEVKLDAEGNIRFDLPCARCGYNLRGLTNEGNCPECGESKADSFKPPKHTLRWKLIPAVPLVGTSVLLSVANHYCVAWSARGHHGSYRSWIMYDVVQTLSGILYIGITAVFLLTFIIMMNRRPDLPMLLALLVTSVLLLAQSVVT